MKRQDLRNIAIIAHVDHGKTTMVDQLLRQNGVFRTNEAVVDRVMDNGDIERERGITILAKNTAVHYKGVKINIIDTPGHADFGGEVERILSMVDGVLLLVDAVEGCMPQTRYVLKKALGLNKKAVVVINKVDRGGDPNQVIDQLIDLFIELGANDDQLDFVTVMASAKQGWASLKVGEVGKDMTPLLDTIIEQIPCPEGDVEDGLQTIICNIDYDEYVGRIGIGRIARGTIKSGQQAVICHTDGSRHQAKISKLYQYEGLKRVDCESGSVGDIVAISGVEISISERRYATSIKSKRCLLSKSTSLLCQCCLWSTTPPLPAKKANSSRRGICAQDSLKRSRPTCQCALKRRTPPTALRSLAEASCIFPYS